MGKTTILVATSGAAPANETATYVVRIAQRLGAELVALHIVQNDESDESGEESLRIFVKIGEQLAVPVIKVLRQGEVNPTIIACAQEHQAAFIIMGVSGGKVVSKWLSADVLEQSEIPVVVIPHQLRQD